MFGLKMNGVFGTQTLSDNPWKADGRDILPALQEYRGEVSANRMTTWGMIGRIAYIAFFVIAWATTIFLWMVVA
jgi:hypothetical protein